MPCSSFVDSKPSVRGLLAQIKIILFLILLFLSVSDLPFFFFCFSAAFLQDQTSRCVRSFALAQDCTMLDALNLKAYTSFRVFSVSLEPCWFSQFGIVTDLGAGNPIILCQTSHLNNVDGWV